MVVVEEGDEVEKEVKDVMEDEVEAFLEWLWGRYLCVS